MSEELHTSPEKNIETQNASSERLEQLQHSPEKGTEKLESNEKSAEKAKVEALDAAVSVEAGSAEKKRVEPAHSSARGPISKKQKAVSYKRTMKQVQSEMTPASRAFSKVIHSPVVEKTSEVIGGTIARPNAILAGAVFAFIATLLTYSISKYYGYVLSGFETIGAFAVGWVVGIVYDYLRLLITGKKA
jgi:hypothetical protein